MYEHYVYRGSAFDRINIYEYLRFVSIVKQSYKFVDGHRQKKNLVQRPLKRIEQLALIVLRRKLSENEELKDAIPRSHPKIDTCCTDLSLIFLSLFVLWNHLSSLFLAKEAALEIYKKYCWKVWVKYELKLWPYVRFYAKNVYQIRKTRIEIWANIAARADTLKAARLAHDIWRDETTYMANSNAKAEIDPINVELAEFGVCTKTSLADIICKTRRKWAIYDYTKYSNNNLIISFIINIEAKSI